MPPSKLLLWPYKDQYLTLELLRFTTWCSRRRPESWQLTAICRHVLVACAVLYAGESGSDAIVLVQQGESQLIFDRHLVNDIPYRGDNYAALIEIPAGHVAKC